MPRATNPRAITIAVMLATFLAALDTTVVGTAMPTVIGELGALDLYSWIFSAYLLTSTTAVPIFGRLADVYGRKPVFLSGAGLFLAGSLLCGAAANMEQLIFFRALQGLGAAAVIPVSMTVVGDIFGIAERAKVQGLLNAVWAVSAILGPGLGAMIVDRLNWRWVFYVNVPFGLVSALLFALYLHEKVAAKKRSVDYGGTTLLTVAITILLVALLEVGETSTPLPLPAWTLAALACGLLALFLWHQSKIPEPLLPMTLFRSRAFSVANAVGFLTGATLMGVTSYVPPFVQGVLGGTAINAGAVLAPISIGWPISSTLSGRLILKCGYRPVVLLGTASILASALMLLPMGQDASQVWVMFSMLVMGFGMGLAWTSFLVAVQSSVEWEERGIATASTSFFRSIGGAVGVAGMGGLMNGGMHQALAALDPGLIGSVNLGAGVSAVSVVLDPVGRAALPAMTLDALRGALASALNLVFWAIALTSLAGLVLTFFFPRTRAEEK